MDIICPKGNYFFKIFRIIANNIINVDAIMTATLRGATAGAYSPTLALARFRPTALPTATAALSARPAFPEPFIFTPLAITACLTGTLPSLISLIMTANESMLKSTLRSIESATTLLNVNVSARSATTTRAVSFFARHPAASDARAINNIAYAALHILILFFGVETWASLSRKLAMAMDGGRRKPAFQVLDKRSQ